MTLLKVSILSAVNTVNPVKKPPPSGGVGNEYCFRRSFSPNPNSLIQPRECQVRRAKGFGIGNRTTIEKPIHCAIRTLKKHWENSQKFGSCPVRRTALLCTFNSLGCFGFFAFLANCLGGLVRPCWIGAWRRAAVVFRVARVVKTLGICMSPSGTDPRPWRL